MQNFRFTRRVVYCLTRFVQETPTNPSTNVLSEVKAMLYQL